MKTNISKIISPAFCLSVMLLCITFSAEAKNTYLVNNPQIEVGQRLAAGEGGVVVGFDQHILKKKIDLKNFQTPEELIEKGTEPQTSKIYYTTSIDILPPDNKGKEKNIRYNQQIGGFVFMGSPGDYVITSISYNDGTFWYTKRVYAHVNVMPGVVKYVGHVQQFVEKGFFLGPAGEIYTLWRYLPNKIQASIVDMLKQQGRDVVFEEAVPQE